MMKQMRIATAALGFFIASSYCESMYKASGMREARYVSMTSSAQAQPALTQAQSAALASYNRARDEFRVAQLLLQRQAMAAVWIECRFLKL